MDTNTRAYSLSQKRKGKIVNLRKQGVEEKIPTSGRSSSRSSQDHEADIDDKEEISRWVFLNAIIYIWELHSTLLHENDREEKTKKLKR